MFLVTSELTKAYGRAIIIIHYSIINFFYLNIFLNVIFPENIKDRMLTLILVIHSTKITNDNNMAKTSDLLQLLAGDQKHIFNYITLALWVDCNHSL